MPPRRQWPEHLAALSRFKTEYGHTNVPTSYSGDKTLANFVRNTRNRYRIQKETKRQHFSQDQLDELKALGFVFQAHKNSRDSTNIVQELLKSIKTLKRMHPEKDDVDFNRFDTCLPTEFEKIPEMCAKVRSMAPKLSQERVKFLRLKGVHIPHVASQPSSSSSFVIFEDPPNGGDKASQDDSRTQDGNKAS